MARALLDQSERVLSSRLDRVPDEASPALFGGEYDRETVINNYDNGVVQADAWHSAQFQIR